MNNTFPALQSIGIRRKRLELSQAKFSKMAGLSQSMLNKIENGVVVPSYKIAIDIFEKLDELENSKEKTAMNIMHKNVVKLKPTDTVEKASRLAKSYSISQFPVVDDDRHVGSIQTIDLIELQHDMKIGAKLNTPFPTVNENTPVNIIREILKHDKAVIVVNKKGISGIITAEDFL
jgi:predicted transcriptional regulator